MDAPDTLLSQQIARLEALERLLAEENQQLVANQWARLEGMAADKIAHFRQIQALEAQRRPHEETPSLRARRRDLLHLVQEANTRNGQIIHALSQFHEGARAILFGPALPLYGDGGQWATGRAGQALGQA